MNYYAHGGLANVAQTLAEKGRNGDTQLVHVSPKELHGLQALAKAHGTSLTTNPDTGLPEAFNLNIKKLLPMAAGAALTIGSGGTLTPLMAAGIVGGGYGLATGSIQKGLMAGIGAYGGAGLGAGIASAGAQTVGEQAAKAAFEKSLENQGLNAAEASMDISNPAAEQAASQARSAITSAPTSNLSNLTSGFGQLGTSQGLSAAYAGMPFGTLPALGATALDAGQQQRASVPGYQEDEYDRRLKGYKLSPDYQVYSAPRPDPYYRTISAAQGGVMDSYDDEPGQDMASGGITSLGGYSDGGRMLKGPGDGMSDSIPGVIGGKQPARLADGEFVVPADVVSHLGNGSTDAGAKKLYSMMDKVRQARTGKKKQAPQVDMSKYLPMGKASGGITGYASGGIVGYAEGGTTNEAIINQIYQDQLGRTPDAGGLKFWSDALANGQSVANITRGINQSVEGQNFDTQYITSLYRQNLDRNPEQSGFQFWLSAAQEAGYTPAEIQRQIVESAKAKEQVDRGIVGQTFTNLQSNALEADPYAGRYVTKSIYDLLPDAVNVSTIGNQKAQFVNPVTQKAVVSNFGNGAYSATDGQSILNEPQVQAAITVARNNGTLSTAGYTALLADLNAAKTPEQTRLALAKPQAQVVVDALYGQQIGENTDLAAAKAEAVKRQAVLSKQDPGYYQNNSVLTDAYIKAGETVPMDYSAYKGVDTRNGQANLFTPDNFQQRQNELVRTLSTYKPTYQSINRNPLPASVRDPYSDEGLKVLYGQMMDQYGPPPEGTINPATEPYAGLYNYKAPISQAMKNEIDAKAKYDAKVAADRLAYDKAGINESNFDAAAYLKAYPEVGNPAVWGGTPYAHYLEANRLGDIRTATKLPFTPTPYKPTVINANPATPTTPTTPTTPAAEAAGSIQSQVGIGNKAGGLMSIKHKKRKA